MTRDLSLKTGPGLQLEDKGRLPAAGLRVGPLVLLPIMNLLPIEIDVPKTRFPQILSGEL